MTDYFLVANAFAAGVLTFFSPCGFPMLPAYVAYYLNLADPEEPVGGASRLARGLAGGAVAGAGALLVIATVGLLAVLAGNAFKQNLLHLELIGGLLVLLMGVLTLAGRAPSFTLPARAMRGRGLVPVASFGALYAAVAASCVAPLFLGTVFTALAAGPADATLILGAYAAGMVGLLVLVTVLLATTRGALAGPLRRALPLMQRAGGLVMVAVGLYLVAYWWRLTHALPSG